MRLEKAVLKGGSIKNLHLPEQSAVASVLPGNLFVVGGNVARRTGIGDIQLPSKSGVPGLKTPVAQYEGSKYFGTVTGEEFISYADIYNKFPVGETLNTTPDTWWKFEHDGKLFFVSVNGVSERVAWEELYTNGLTYGNDSHLSLDGLDQWPTNRVMQNKRVYIGGSEYRVRLIDRAEWDLVIWCHTGQFDSFSGETTGVGIDKLATITRTLSGGRQHGVYPPYALGRRTLDDSSLYLTSWLGNFWRPVLEIIR